jgi:hypothetical protein
LDVRGVANFGSRVGIGTNNPQQALEVHGNILLGKNNVRSFIHGGSDMAFTCDSHVLIVSDANDTTDGGGSDVIFGYGGALDINTARDATYEELFPTFVPRVETMRIKASNGRVGINDGTPSYKLDVNGTFRCFGFTNSSDDRIKYNEENVSNALSLISQLKPQKYEKMMEKPNPVLGTWIPTDEEWENVKDNYEHGEEFGLIAQDVQKIPELAFLVTGEETRIDTKTLTTAEYNTLTAEERDEYTQTSEGYAKQVETQTPLSLNYQGLFVLAIGAIKELKAKNEVLETQVSDLLERVTALENTETA